MNDFSFLVPTKVIFGKNSLDSLSNNILDSNPTKVLVLYGSGSVVENGILEKVETTLKNANIPYVTLGGVKANPMLSFVYSARDFAIKNNVDFILSVGGGSVLDTAKSVAHSVATPSLDIWDCYTHGVPVEKTIPVGCVLTISAAGSETSNSAVLTNDDTLLKRGLRTELNRPKFAILNPEFTFTLPKYQVACGVVDILMHTLDRYFAKPYDNEITNQIAEALLRTVFKYGKTLVSNPCDYEASSEIMWCGSLSHNGITGLGSVMDFCPHQLSHDISGRFDTAHGATLAVTWNGFANYVYKNDPERFARYAKNVLGLEGDDTLALAKAGIDATVSYFKELGMPTTFKELLNRTLTDDEIDSFALSCSFNKTRKIGSFVVLDYDDMRNIYMNLNQ